MTFRHPQAADRSLRRARRVSRRWGAGVLLALLALIAQGALPHLHLSQVREHAAPSSGVWAPSAGTDRNDDGHRTALRASHEDGASEHSESRCPICQTIAQARDFLVTTSALPANAPAQHTAVALALPWLSPTRDTAHAPRSPPHAA